MAVYMLADTHFNHKNAIKWRNQFHSIEDHDQYILDNILSVVGKRDTLYLLGDSFVGPGTELQLSVIAEHVEFLHLVLGNHCAERAHAPKLDTLMQYAKSVTGLKPYKNAWLSHAPLHPDSLRNKICVHGHTHGDYPYHMGPGYFCVSCEAIGYKPINFVTIQELMRDSF